MESGLQGFMELFKSSLDLGMVGAGLCMFKNFFNKLEDKLDSRSDWTTFGIPEIKDQGPYSQRILRI